MFIIDHFAKSVPSPISKGDVVEWVYWKDVIGETTFEELRKIARKSIVNRVWIEYNEWSCSFSIGANIDGAESALNSPFLLGNSDNCSKNERKLILAINGKRKFRFDNICTGKYDSVFTMKSKVVGDDKAKDERKEDNK